MTRKVSTQWIALAIAALLPVWLAGGTAHATDVYPGDFTILPKGTNLALLYGVQISADQLNIKGARIPDSRLQATFTLLRYVRYEEIADVPVLVEAILPIGGYHDVRIAGTPQPTENGLGDLILATAAFPVHTKNTTLGLATYLYLPTGAYDPAKISFGTHSYNITPQVGLIQKLGARLLLDVTADVAFTTSHVDGGVRFSVEPSYQLQIYLRRALSPTTSLALGYSGHFGGRQRLDGVDSGLKSNSHQVRAFAGKFVTKTLQVQLMGGVGAVSDGGFRQKFNGQVRLLKVF